MNRNQSKILLILTGIFLVSGIIETKALALEIVTPNWEYGKENFIHWGQLKSEFALYEVGKQQSPIDLLDVRAPNQLVAQVLLLSR